MSKVFFYSAYLGAACLSFEALLLWCMWKASEAGTRAALTMVPTAVICTLSFAMLLLDANYLAAVASLIVLVGVGLLVVPGYRYLRTRKARER